MLPATMTTWPDVDRDALLRILVVGMFVGAAVAGSLADRARRRSNRRSGGPAGSGTGAPSATIAADADPGRQPRPEDPSAPRG